MLPVRPDRPYRVSAEVAPSPAQPCESQQHQEGRGGLGDDVESDRRIRGLIAHAASLNLAFAGLGGAMLLIAAAARLGAVARAGKG